LLERQSYSVEGIIKALSELEGDLDAISSKVEELKKHMINKSQEEIDKLKQQMISNAQEEAKRIIDKARTEAEADSVIVSKESEENLARIRKNINSLSDTMIDRIVKVIVKGSASYISGSKRRADEGISRRVEQTP
jgi:V/A-type H+/Na+-transporting ATPase subunit G/H